MTRSTQAQSLAGTFLLLVLLVLPGWPLPATAGQAIQITHPVYDPVAVLAPDLPQELEQDHPEGIGFGHAVAVYDDTLVVGAPRTRTHTTSQYGGAVFIYRRVEGQWQLSQLYPFDFLTLPDHHGCGHSVAVDSYNVLIGCPERGGESGATVLLTRSSAGADFELANSHFNAGGSSGERCGSSVGLIDTETSGTYPLAAIGCPGRVLGGSSLARERGSVTGAVDLQFYCPPFAPCAGILGVGWHPISSVNGTLGARGGAPAAAFGTSVKFAAYFGAQVILAVGAPQTGPELNGRVDVFRAAIDDLQSWTLDHTLTGEDGAELGASVGLRSWNSILWVAAGAPGMTEVPDEVGNGGLLVVSRSPFAWSDPTIIFGSTSANAGAAHRFGYSVAFLASTDPQPDLAGGAPQWPGLESRGLVERFQRNESGHWLPAVDEPFRSDDFPDGAGMGHSMSARGPWLAAGAPAHPDGAGNPQGRVFLYVRGDRLFHDRFEE